MLRPKHGVDSEATVGKVMVDRGVEVVPIMTEQQSLGAETKILSALSPQRLDGHLVRYLGQSRAGARAVQQLLPHS